MTSGSLDGQTGQGAGLPAAAKAVGVQDDGRARAARRTRTGGWRGPDVRRCPVPRACPCGCRRPGSPPAMLPSPPKRTAVPVTWTMPTAPPRVRAHPAVRAFEQRGRFGRRVLEHRGNRLRGRGGGQRAVTEPVAQHAGHASPSGCAAPKLSPHSVSPVDGPGQPGAGGPCRAPARARTGPPATVPWPGTEYRSQKSASRRIAPRPIPRVPRGGMTVAQRRAGITQAGPAVDGHHLDARRPSSSPADAHQQRCPGGRACAGSTPPRSPPAASWSARGREPQPAGQRHGRAAAAARRRSAPRPGASACPRVPGHSAASSA